MVYRNASAIGNIISKVFSGIVGAIKQAASLVYAFLNRFTEFKIIFGIVNVARGMLNLLGKTILWIGNSIVATVAKIGVKTVISRANRRLPSPRIARSKCFGRTFK